MLARQRGVGSVTRVAKMAVLRSMGRSDYKRWGNTENLEEWWESLTQQLARMIPTGTRVSEFGAGRRRLEAFLDPSCTSRTAWPPMRLPNRRDSCGGPPLAWGGRITVT